jgi:hypothetical protein
MVLFVSLLTVTEHHSFLAVLSCKTRYDTIRLDRQIYFNTWNNFTVVALATSVVAYHNQCRGTLKQRDLTADTP